MKRSTLVLLAITLLLVATIVVAGLLIKPKSAGLALPDSTPEDITAASTAGLPYVVKLGSDDCDACKLIDPVLVSLADKLEGQAKFIKIDVYKYPKVAAQYRVTVIPTLVYFDAAGTKLDMIEGFMDEQEIIDVMKGFGMI